jgi:hypothetical protein
VLRERGFAHENAYLEYLAAQGMSIVDLRDILDDELAIAETFAALERGVDVIAQATLAKGRWFGWADVLRRVERAGKFGGWSYEVGTGLRSLLSLRDEGPLGANRGILSQKVRRQARRV